MADVLESREQSKKESGASLMFVGLAIGVAEALGSVLAARGREPVVVKSRCPRSSRCWGVRPGAPGQGYLIRGNLEE